MNNNAIFNLLCRDRVSPMGWGFPPSTLGARSGNVALRRLLCFLDDDDGHAQLIRWYHAMIRNFPGVWRTLAGKEEGYNPHLFHKQVLESRTLVPGRSLVTGTMELGWIPGIETTSLTGTVESGALTLGNTSYAVQFQPGEDDRSELVLPALFQCRTSVLTSATGGSNTLIFRPRAFNSASVVERLKQAGADDLNRAGLLDAFLSVPRPEDKLAIAWLALARLEDVA